MSNDSSSLAYNYCALPLAVYACRPDLSRGRIVKEEESRHRTAFQRDRDRIIHTSAFRRLKYKTQVFVYHEGDHYRTRLSHTIEVAQIARTLARAMMVNEDLAEAVALAHDLGHTPFAHMGEDVLKICMTDFGGFYHNDQSLRILTTLEQKYPLWTGLNLTWEILEGVAKHNGPVLKKGEKISRDNLSVSLYELSQKMDMELDKYASLEAQCAAIADDIAYNNHDVEDGLRAGFFTLDEIERLELFKKPLADIRKTYPNITPSVLVAEMIRDMIGMMVVDVLDTSMENIERLNPQSSKDVSNAGQQIVCFSAEMDRKMSELRQFLFERMYRHYSVERITLKVKRILPDLFNAFLNQYRLLPDHWQRRVEVAGGVDNREARARVVCDYIAGMTDRFAIREHERMFDLYWDLK
jgi:dGTPase